MVLVEVVSDSVDVVGRGRYRVVDERVVVVYFGVYVVVVALVVYFVVGFILE